MSVGHSDVMLQLIREYQSFNSPQVEYRESSPTALEFSRILRSNRPVIFRNALSHWPALTKWQTPGYLRKVMGDQLITVAETPDGHADSIVNGYFVEPHQNTIPFTEMLSWLSSRKGGERSPVRYVQSQNGNLSGEFERLRVDTSELEWANECIGEFPDASNIWIGNEESTTSPHFDHYENLYCQIVGSKTFYLIPPSEYACLKEKVFPSARWTPSEEDPPKLTIKPLDGTTPWLTVDPSSISESDNEDPLLRSCKPLVATLLPGEVLYLPALWFHSVSQVTNSDGLCIAVNYWYDMDFSALLYPMFNFIRHSAMIEDGRSDEILLDTE